MTAIGVITIGYAVAFISMVAVEAPAKKIEKFIIFSFSKKKESQKNGDKTLNTETLVFIFLKNLIYFLSNALINHINKNPLLKRTQPILQ